jgi:hypothetical protein
MRKSGEVPIIEDDLEDDFYDRHGKINPGGMFDVSGHIIGDRYRLYRSFIRQSKGQ